jgi:hypothetical protein
LTPAPRRQDHTTSPYASVTLVRRNIGVHRNPPNVRDDGQRPSEQDGMAIDVPLICPSGKAKYFLFQGLTRFLKIRSDLPVGLFCRSQVARLRLRGGRRSWAFRKINLKELR